MRSVFCPRCGSTKLQNLPIEATFKCLSCGYIGSLNLQKDLFKQAKK